MKLSHLTLIFVGLFPPMAQAKPAKKSPVKQGAKPSSRSDRAPAQKCLRELKKLRSAARFDLTYEEFSSRVAISERIFDDSLKLVTSVPLRAELKAAFDNLVDVRNEMAEPESGHKRANFLARATQHINKAEQLTK